MTKTEELDAIDEQVAKDALGWTHQENNLYAGRWIAPEKYSGWFHPRQPRCPQFTRSPHGFLEVLGWVKSHKDVDYVIFHKAKCEIHMIGEFDRDEGDFHETHEGLDYDPAIALCIAVVAMLDAEKRDTR